MKWSYKVFRPDIISTFNEELHSCIQQIKFFIDDNIDNKIIRLNIFIAGNDISDFQNQKSAILNSMSFEIKQQFILEVLPQKPVGSKLLMKAMYFDSSVFPAKVKYAEDGDLKLVEISSSESKIILSSISSFLGDIVKDSTNCFSFTENNLKSKGLDFGHVGRQWNYIGAILNSSTINDSFEQNYQVFNNIRSDYYKDSKFNNGYPAATGIGMDLPGIILQVIAYKPFGNLRLVAINNPLQIPAHQYSENVLVRTNNDLRTCTPKFERAKVVVSELGNWIYVSGTASIKGEQHIREKNAKAQTIETLNLIEELVSKENLKNYNIQQTIETLKPTTYRAYVKHEGDVEEVWAECKKFFGNIPSVTLVADVCRNELLVEIECEFEL